MIGQQEIFYELNFCDVQRKTFWNVWVTFLQLENVSSVYTGAHRISIPDIMMTLQCVSLIKYFICGS